MDKDKIAFIICSNDEQYLRECIFYINALKIPDGMSIDIIPVNGAVSMCSGYNIGMRSSDAKYKIYIHQDVFILNRDLISDFLSVFSADKEIGMIGVSGSSDLPADAMCFSEWNTGSVMECSGYRMFMYRPFQEKAINYVWAVDGLMIITNRDIPWREDVFDGWDFYDISQGMEFMKAGLKAVVPYQEHPWCLHDNGILNLDSYDKNRKIFCETYSEYFRYDETEEHKKQKEENHKALDEIYKILPEIRKLFDEGKYKEAVYLTSKYKNYKNKNSELLAFYTISRITLAEWKFGKNCFIKKGQTSNDLIRKYQELRFLLFRLSTDMEPDKSPREMIDAGEISDVALELLIYITVYDKTKVYRKLLNDYGIAVSKINEEDFYCPVCGHQHTVIRYEGEERQRQRDYGFYYHSAVTDNYSDEHTVCPGCGSDEGERFLRLFLQELKSEDGQPLKGFNLVSEVYDPGMDAVLKSELIQWQTDNSNGLKKIKSESVDLILGIDVLQREIDDRNVIQELYRILKNDGLGVLVLPITHGLVDTVEAGEIGDALRIQHTGSYTARRLYSEWDFVNRLIEVGFYVQKIVPEYFGELAVRAKIGDYRSMYIVAKSDFGLQGIPMSEFYPNLMKKVSVILPTYNREKTLEKAVRSVLSQSWRNIELLVVDDGSVDNTPVLMNRLAAEDNRIRYIRYERNQGASHARNVGIEHAEGDYIAFQDSDDEWHKDHVRKLVTELMYKGPDYGMVFCDFVINSDRYGSIRIPVENYDKKKLSGDIFTYLLTHFFISTQCVLIRKKILEKTKGFNEQLRAMEDWELFLRISRVSLISEVPEVLVTVADTRHSLTDNDIAHAEAFLYVCELYDLINTYPEAYQRLLKMAKERLKRVI
ncbi:Glycosyl transferase family 2 [Lachnospiraceae bacterium]|nr:Glycosyl transferase family 2 [Lachnospiraceae bacterium]